MGRSYHDGPGPAMIYFLHNGSAEPAGMEGTEVTSYGKLVWGSCGRYFVYMSEGAEGKSQKPSYINIWKDK